MKTLAIISIKKSSFTSVYISYGDNVFYQNIKPSSSKAPYLSEEAYAEYSVLRLLLPSMEKGENLTIMTGYRQDVEEMIAQHSEIQVEPIWQTWNYETDNLPISIESAKPLKIGGLETIESQPYAFTNLGVVVLTNRAISTALEYHDGLMNANDLKHYLSANLLEFTSADKSFVKCGELAFLLDQTETAGGTQNVLVYAFENKKDKASEQLPIKYKGEKFWMQKTTYTALLNYFENINTDIVLERAPFAFTSLFDNAQAEINKGKIEFGICNLVLNISESNEIFSDTLNNYIDRTPDWANPVLIDETELSVTKSFIHTFSKWAKCDFCTASKSIPNLLAQIKEQGLTHSPSNAQQLFTPLNDKTNIIIKNVGERLIAVGLKSSVEKELILNNQYLTISINKEKCADALRFFKKFTKTSSDLELQEVFKKSNIVFSMFEQNTVKRGMIKVTMEEYNVDLFIGIPKNKNANLALLFVKKGK